MLDAGREQRRDFANELSGPLERRRGVTPVRRDQTYALDDQACTTSPPTSAAHPALPTTFLADFSDRQQNPTETPDTRNARQRDAGRRLHHATVDIH